MMVLLLLAAALAADVPPPEVRITLATDAIDAPAPVLKIAAGSSVALKAKVMGGQRAWCMDPEKYVSIGANTVIESRGPEGCVYSVETGEFSRTGTWTAVEEFYTWTASAGLIAPGEDYGGAYATFHAPKEGGTVTLTAQGTVRWHLDSVTSRDQTDGPVRATLTIQVEGSASTISHEEAYDRVVRKFLADIKPGVARGDWLTDVTYPGLSNNTWNLTGYEGYAETTCGGYQAQVLRLLDTMRLSGTADDKAIFEHWDYGPVQAYFGGHQAVVLYPKGGDWGSQGVVLDPWPNQRPEVYTIADWKDRFKFGVATSTVYEGIYPLNGGAHYPGEMGLVPPDQAAVFRTLSKEERRKVILMSAEDRRVYLASLSDAQKARVGVIAHSPVSLLATSQYGQRVGFLPDGSFAYEIPGTDVVQFPEADGTWGTAYFLPYNVYDVTVTGQAPGTYDLTVAMPPFAAGEKIVRYEHVATSTGSTATVGVSPLVADRPAIVAADGTTVTASKVSRTTGLACPLGSMSLLLLPWWRRRR